MTDFLQMSLSIIGGVGGLIGIWAAVATFRRDRARVAIELKFSFQNSPDREAAQVLGPPERKAYYLTTTFRNVGYRPVFLEQVRFEYEKAYIAARCEVVLEETRRSHTVHYDLDTGITEQPEGVVVIDHRGTQHRAKLRASTAMLWLYGKFRRCFPRRLGDRLHIAKSLRDYYAHARRDPYGLRVYIRDESAG
jgi:hypothetical protein